MRSFTMRWQHVCLALPLAAVFSLTARADVLDTFDLRSQFQSGATATGTITIDETKGTAVLVDITYVSSGLPTVYDMIAFPTQFEDGNEFTVLGNRARMFDLETPGTWVGYNGGLLCSLIDNCPVPDVPNDFYVSAVISDGD